MKGGLKLETKRKPHGRLRRDLAGVSGSQILVYRNPCGVFWVLSDQTPKLVARKIQGNMTHLKQPGNGLSQNGITFSRSSMCVFYLVLALRKAIVPRDVHVQQFRVCHDNWFQSTAVFLNAFHMHRHCSEACLQSRLREARSSRGTSAAKHSAPAYVQGQCHYLLDDGSEQQTS